MPILIDGEKIARTIEDRLKQEIKELPRPPGIAFIAIGNHLASHTYIRMKKKRGLAIGIRSFDLELAHTTSEKELLEHIEKLNERDEVDGILLQLPLPPHLSAIHAMAAIRPDKDVDGFHPLNMGKLLLGETDGFIPCTPLGIVRLFEVAKIATDGKHVVIVGRSNIVGKPLAALLMQKRQGANATVTIAHSATLDLPRITKSADILIAAIGQPRTITASMVRPGAVVIDVGINRIGDEIVGDVDFASVAPLASHITPVPKGVGPMTIAMLLSNTLLSYRRRVR